jgi:hypothetical protein
MPTVSCIKSQSCVGLVYYVHARIALSFNIYLARLLYDRILDENNPIIEFKNNHLNPFNVLLHDQRQILEF